MSCRGIIAQCFCTSLLPAGRLSDNIHPVRTSRGRCYLRITCALLGVYAYDMRFIFVLELWHSIYFLIPGRDHQSVTGLDTIYPIFYLPPMYIYHVLHVL